MKPGKNLVASLSAIALSFASVGLAASPVMGKVTGHSQCSGASDLQAQEECACEAALKEDTIEALEEFLQKYGPTSGTACMALARVSLDRFRPDSDPDIGKPTDGSPY